MSNFIDKYMNICICYNQSQCLTVTMLTVEKVLWWKLGIALGRIISIEKINVKCRSVTGHKLNMQQITSTCAATFTLLLLH